jgi:hypothetical protein
MKSLITFSFLIASLSFASCHKPPPPPPEHPYPPHKDVVGTVPDNAPACIQDEIRKMQAEPVANPPASIWSYDYLGQTVFYIPPQCCDVTSKLLDQNCNELCSPDGGLTGRGDGKCPEFFDKRTDEKLVWKDDRQLN